MPAMVRARVQRPTRALLAASAVALLCAKIGLSAVTSFVAPRTRARSPAVLRQASGFSDEVAATQPRKASNKVELSQDQLEKDHGDAWEMVDDVLKGKKAASPEAIMRARFTALRYKDVGFLAATEEDTDATVKERSTQWAITLGLKEKSFLDNLLRMGGEDIESLADAQKFEVISSDDSTVDFKITCGNGKALREKSKFKKDKKWGYIYSGESVMSQWS